MASLPASPAEAGSPRRALLPRSDFLAGLGGLGVLRQLGLMIGLAASVALGVAVVLWSRGSDYRPLYGSLERLDSAAVLDVLDSHRIGYRIDPATGALLVESDKVNEARLKLAGAGVPGDRVAGFESLGQEQPLGTSQFMEAARYRHSLEGELARTIASITSVRSARVHLAIPKETVFLRDARPPSASVFVELFPGATLQPAQVRSVINLVASSIPQLTAENVTVVDQRGALLSQQVMEDHDMLEANRRLEFGQRIERQLRERVATLLAPLVGANKFQAEVAATVDFTAVEEAGEVYNPDLPAIRSEQRIHEQRAEGQVAGVPGALSNQPPADGAAPEQALAPGQNAALAGTAAGGGERSREQTVRNYELDRTVSYTRHQVGRLQRLSVAVAVDHRPPAEAGGEPRPWSAEELERLAVLVRNAVGFDAARGDTVNVVNAPFVAVAEESGTSHATPFWQQPWLQSLARQAGALVLLLVLVLAVLRPVMKSLSQGAAEPRPPALPPELGLAGALPEETVTLSGGPGDRLLPGPDSSYEQQITAIKGLIAEDPGRVAQVVKKWVASSE